MPRTTEHPLVSPTQSLKQRSLIVAIVVLGLGALGATVGLQATRPAPLEAVPLRAPGFSAVPAHAQVHHLANADLDVGPGEAEPTLVACPPAVR